MTAKKVWALLDERQGNTSQTLGVAEALGLPFESKKIAFNPLVRLPNPLIYHSAIGIAARSRPEIAPPWPDIVISTARRLGLVASCIKHRNPATFLAQIQWPGAPAAHFDLIATPLHDGIEGGKNVILTLGAPHRVTESALKLEAGRWHEILAPYPSPRIAMLAGGATRSRDFARKHAVQLAQRGSALAHALGGSLLVTTSRRTGREATEILSENITCPYYLYKWDDRGDDQASPEANPFYGILGLADAVIATGDSISMCSEACAAGKAVYIYASGDFMSSKHQAFVKELFARGMAKPLDEQAKTLFTPATALNDSAFIAAEIRKRAAL